MWRAIAPTILRSTPRLPPWNSNPHTRIVLFVYHDTGLGAVAGFLHQIEYIHAVAELYVNARGAPLHAKGLVFRVYRPCRGMGRGVKMHGSHIVRPGPCESVTDQFIREFMAYVLRSLHSFHFCGSEDGSIGNLVPVILRAHL